MPYWFYRKDWFTEKRVAVPTTWDNVRKLGPVFTDESQGVWASVDGLIKGAFLNIYLAWVALQAGGSPFDLGEPYKMVLEYIHDLMYIDKVLNPASLQKDYNFVNAWNNLLYPLSFSVSPHAKTLSVAITEVFAGYSPWGKPWELIMAVGVTMVVPIVLMVLVSQRAIVSGLTRGALK